MSLDSHMPSQTALPTALQPIMHQEALLTYFSQLAANQSFPHTLLLVGPDSAGNLEAALAYAQLLMCAQGGCASCASCTSIAQASGTFGTSAHPDVTILSPAGANGYLIEDIRQLIAEVPLAAVRSDKKLYIITAADKLGSSASNALLKLLEEPPAHVYFVLIASLAQALLPTIVSRAQMLTLKGLPFAEATERLRVITNSPLELCQRAYMLHPSLSAAREWLTNTQVQRSFEELSQLLIQALNGQSAFGCVRASQALVKAAQQRAAQTCPSMEEFVASESAYKEFMSASVAKAREQAYKRRVAAAQKSALLELMHYGSFVLRDLLMLATHTADTLLVSSHKEALEPLARRAGVRCVQEAYTSWLKAEEDIKMGMTPTLVLDAVLLHMREVLACPV